MLQIQALSKTLKPHGVYKNCVSIVQTQSGNLRVQASPNALAQHLVMDSKGNTYLIAGMDLLSIETDIKFLTTANEALSVRELRRERDDLGELVNNKRLKSPKNFKGIPKDLKKALKYSEEKGNLKTKEYKFSFRSFKGTYDKDVHGKM